MTDLFDDLPDVFRKAQNSNRETSDLQAIAEQTIKNLSDLYLKHTKTDIEIMLDLLSKALKAPSQKRFALIREDFFRKAHDMKGEGSTFDYPLLTFLGQIICDYLRNKNSISDTDLKILQDCLTDVQNVFENHITGEGGIFGQSLRQKWGNINV